MCKKITSTIFSDIAIADENGFYGDIKDLNTGLIINLNIFEEIKSENHLSMIPEFLDNYQSLSKQAKNYILHKLEDGENAAKFYYDFHREELPNELLELLNNEEQSNENLVKYTCLSSIWFSLDKDDLIATFDYKILNDYSNEILAIRFNQNKEIISITHES